MQIKLKFSLLDNALDSLALGLEFALSDRQDKSKLKLAVLLVAQSVELLLKERLRREHWSLIYRNVDKAGSYDAITVSINEAKKRLATITNITLSKDHDDAVEEIRKTRNRIQHFEVNITFEQVVAQVNAAIQFLISFLHAELDIDIRDVIPVDVYQSLVEIEELATELRELAVKRVEEVEKEYQPTKLADLAASDFETILCPQCFEEFYTFMPSHSLSVCQFCGYEGGFVECARCGSMYPAGDMMIHSSGPDFAMCENCWRDLMAE